MERLMTNKPRAASASPSKMMRAAMTLLHRESTRSRMLFLVTLMMLGFNSLTALALNEGPWTFDSRRYGSCYINSNNTMSFWGLGNSTGWPVSITQYQNQSGKYGTGFTITGGSFATDKLGVFSVFYHTENVPSYTRRVLNQNLKCISIIQHIGILWLYISAMMWVRSRT